MYIKRLQSEQRGFSLIEVVVSLGIFAIVMATMAPAFVAQSRFNTLNERRSEAAAAAQLALDDIRIQDISSLPTSGTAGPVNRTVGNRTYSVLTTYCAVSSYCASSTMRHLTIDVSLNNDQLFSVETVFSDLR